MTTEYLRIISRRPGATIYEIEEGVVLKAGPRVRPAELLAMELVFKHTKVPVPEPVSSSFGSRHGQILMPLVPGDCLKDVWADLDAEDKTSICTQVWKFVEDWRCIPKPSKLQHLYACSVEGKLGTSPFISCSMPSVEEKDSDILSDETLRERICENYYNFFGRQYTKAQLFDMLPRSDNASVFTHGDLAPKNIMVSGSQVTGIIDWEEAGWYPEYWEYLCSSLHQRFPANRDWATIMEACAPQTWDLEGFFAASRALK